MRLWSLHPRYLDAAGLLAVWREGLLAQKVLQGQTRGYRSHPQLARFQELPEPAASAAAFLEGIWHEGLARGYRLDPARIQPRRDFTPIQVTDGQLAYEWQHLRRKLAARSPARLAALPDQPLPDPHPLFIVVAGPIAAWERPNQP